MDLSAHARGLDAAISSGEYSLACDLFAAAAASESARSDAATRDDSLVDSHSEVDARTSSALVAASAANSLLCSIYVNGGLALHRTNRLAEAHAAYQRATIIEPTSHAARKVSWRGGRMEQQRECARVAECE
jgi:hypothetical protein